MTVLTRFRRRYRRVSLSLAGLLLGLVAGCGDNSAPSGPNPATMTKEQRVQIIENDSSLTPEQKAAKRAQVEELERQTQAARSMGPGVDAPPGLKKQ